MNIEVDLERLSRVVEDHTDRISDLSIRLTKVETMDLATTATLFRIEKELEKVNGNTTWLVRLIVGAIMGGLITMLFNGVPTLG